MPFNTSQFNSIGLGHQEETINGHFVLPHSNEIGLVSSQLLTNNPIIGLNQNEIISQRSHPIVGLGQLGLSQRVTEVRRAYVTPRRVQVHTLIDYFPMQNQPDLPLSVTEVVRTQFLTPTSSTENIFAPNDTVHIQGQPSFHNQSVNDLFTRNVPSHGPFYPNLTQTRQALNLLGFANHSEPKRDGVLSSEPTRVYVPEANLNPIGNQIPNHGQLGINFQNLGMTGSSNNQMRISNLVNPLRAPSSERVPSSDRISNLINPLRVPNSERDPSSMRVPSPVVQINPDDDSDVEDDGRTHSLPRKKNGPYTCPKCGRVFYTSQSFAAHIGSHYKLESRIEKKKRQAARYKKKYLRLFQSHDGLTVMPASFKMIGRGNAYGKGKVATKIKEKEVLKQEQVVPKVAVGVKIKEELM